MFLTLTKKYGKPICVALYAAFTALAAKKKPIPLIVLFFMHATEYIFIGRKVAAEKGLSALEGLGISHSITRLILFPFSFAPCKSIHGKDAGNETP